MGLSRRQFTKEFKLAVVRRLEQGISMGEARERWRSAPTSCSVGAGSFAKDLAMSFSVAASSAGPNVASPSWNGRLAAGFGDRFFAGVLPAHRRTADATGTDWKSAVLRKVQEEMKAERGLTATRMAELGGLSCGLQYAEPSDTIAYDIRRVALVLARCVAWRTGTDTFPASPPQTGACTYLTWFSSMGKIAEFRGMVRPSRLLSCSCVR